MTPESQMAEQNKAGVFLPRKAPRTGLLIFAGIILPLTCILLDPIVFHLRGEAAGIYHEPVLWKWQPFAYAAVCLACVLTVLYLVRRWLPAILLPFLGGGLASASVLSFALGCRVLPTSLLGLLILVGVLGFSPFLSSVSYFLAARAAYRETVLTRSRHFARIGVLLGFVLYLAIACSLHVTIDRGFDAVLASAAKAAPTTASMNSLKIYTRVFGDFRLVHAYQSTLSEQSQQYLAATYRQLTGKDIMVEVSINND